MKLRYKNQRLAPEVYADIGRPCFFTVRAAPGTNPFAHPDRARSTVECLLASQSRSGCEVLAYCAMQDHIHVLVAPKDEGASSLTFVDGFKGRCTRRLRQAGWEGPVWQRRSYDHVLRKDEDVDQIASYIVHNPVRRGWCVRWEEWPWSGILPVSDGV